MRGHDLLADQLQEQQSSSSASSQSTALRHHQDFVIPPKILLHGYGPTGFDVGNALKNVQAASEDVNNNNHSTMVTTTSRSQSSSAAAFVGDGTLHMNGSILAFPRACFLWNVRDINDLTLPSLSPIVLHQKPSRIEYLFLGINPSPSNDGGILDARIHPNLQKIQNVMYRQHNVVVEVMDLLNAIGTFNVLNAEDRMVATALLLDPTATDDDDDDGGDSGR